MEEYEYRSRTFCWGILLFLESLSACVSLSVSLIRLRFRGNDDDEKNVKEMMMILR